MRLCSACCIAASGLVIPLVVVCSLDYVKLEYATPDKESDGYSTEPPCERNACCETGDHQKDAPYCVAYD